MRNFIFSGDTHGRMKHHFEDNGKDLSNQYVFILGDFGVPFADLEHAEKEFNWMAEQDCTWIALLGNHDNYDYWQEQEIVKGRFGKDSEVRIPRLFGRTYENIFVIEQPTILDIEDAHILCIPRAGSIDKAFRTPHVTWWEQENGNIQEEREFVYQHADEYFDYVLTHDCPDSFFNTLYAKEYYIERIEGFYRPVFFEELAEKLNFKFWLHGHMHQDNMFYFKKDKFFACLYWYPHEAGRLDYYYDYYLGSVDND